MFARTHPSVHKYHIYFLQDSCEQFEWRLLLGTRDSAWQILLLKAAPGARVWCSTVYMLGLILPSSQTCVRRRAVLSVMANPNCQDKESAERAVNEVWESCFNDTRPFDEVCPKPISNVPSRPYASFFRYINRCYMYPVSRSLLFPGASNHAMPLLP
jgi:hypothetical protein